MSDLSQMPGPEGPDQHDQIGVVQTVRTATDHPDQKILFSQVKNFWGWSGPYGPLFYRAYWSGGPPPYRGDRRWTKRTGLPERKYYEDQQPSGSKIEMTRQIFTPDKIKRLGRHDMATALPDPPQADRVRHRVRVGDRPRLLPRGWSAAKASPVASAPVVAYADLTLLGGRHRQRDVKPEGHPELHPIAERLVCASISDGNSGFPAVLRDCGCGKQLWVSTAMLELVDARTLHAACLGCHLTDRKPLALHSAAMPTLHLMGRSADAWRCVAMLDGLPC